LGFPDFTRFFNSGFPLKLQLGVHFTMAVRAQENAFLDLFADRFPTSCVSPVGNTEVLLRRIKVVKLQSLTTPIVPAPTASTTQVFDCHLPYLLAPPFDGFYQIRAAISVCSLVSPRDCALLYSRMLYH
jgi:hypothetical protein